MKLYPYNMPESPWGMLAGRKGNVPQRMADDADRAMTYLGAAVPYYAEEAARAVGRAAQPYIGDEIPPDDRIERTESPIDLVAALAGGSSAQKGFSAWARMKAEQGLAKREAAMSVRKEADDLLKQMGKYGVDSVDLPFDLDDKVMTRVIRGVKNGELKHDVVEYMRPAYESLLKMNGENRLLSIAKWHPEFRDKYRNLNRVDIHDLKRLLEISIKQNK